MSTLLDRPPANYKRPDLYAAQYNAIWANGARYGVVEASTKTGKTIGCMVWLLEQALRGRPGWSYWWGAPVYGTAAIAFRRYKAQLRAMQLPFAASATDAQVAVPAYQANNGAMTLTLPNGALIWFKSMEHPDALYGEDVYAAVIDEATRCREEAWHAFRSTLTATRGPVRIIGNVKGRKNWAYKLARLAEHDTTGTYAYAKLTAWDAVRAGVLDVAEILDARRVLPAHIFQELYLAEPAEDAGNPFGLAAIRACLRAGLSLKRPVVWGWDLGRKIDWTVGCALDEDGALCHLERFQRPWAETITTIRRVVGDVPAWLDATGVGDAPTQELQRTGDNFHPFIFTGQSKQNLMETLAIAIQQQEVHFPPGVVADELEEFEYEYTRTGVRYSAPPGQHDDAVCALALAVRHRVEAAGAGWRVL